MNEIKLCMDCKYFTETSDCVCPELANMVDGDNYTNPWDQRGNNPLYAICGKEGKYWSPRDTDWEIRRIYQRISKLGMRVNRLENPTKLTKGWWRK